jgi:hypothetical protein
MAMKKQKESLLKTLQERNLLSHPMYKTTSANLSTISELIENQ